MNYDELVELVKLADENLIKQRLERLGFRDCKKDERLKKANIVYIIQGTIFNTDGDYFDKTKTNTYSGYVCVENNEFQGMLFVLIERCKLNRSIKAYVSDGFLVYSKENS